jgi:hypothetical protein
MGSSISCLISTIATKNSVILNTAPWTNPFSICISSDSVFPIATRRVRFVINSMMKCSNFPSMIFLGYCISSTYPKPLKHQEMASAILLSRMVKTSVLVLFLAILLTFEYVSFFQDVYQSFIYDPF